MRVSIIKDRKIQNLILPEKINGSYWITDTDSNGIKRNLISIESDNNNWKLVSNKDVYYENNGVIEQFVYLRNLQFYTLKNNIENTKILIYCSPILTEYNCFEIDSYIDSGITIGSLQNSIISYSILGQSSYLIKRINGKVYIIDNNSDYGTYVNNIRVIGQKELKIGDFIFIMGLKIIYNVIENDKGQKFICLHINNLTVSNISVKFIPSGLFKPMNRVFNENEDEIEYQLYDEKEYFHKTPRFINEIKTLELQVDAPPAKPEDQNQSLLMTIGPMITMSLTSMVTGYTAVNNVLSGNSTWSNAMPSLVICGAMFASVFIWPLFNKFIEKRKRKENEKLRQEKYSKYIESKRKLIIDAKQQQTNILCNNYPQIKDVQDLIINRYTTLWQRRIEDNDYLTVSLGNGQFPMKINIKYPEDHFSMVEDNLKDMVLQLGNEPKMLSNVPIVFSFIDNYVSGLIGEEQLTSEYMRRLLLQILAFHSYDDLKIVILTDDEKEYQWDFMRNAPHCFSDDKLLRFFATNNDEYKEVCYYLDKIFNSRKEQFGTTDIKMENLDKIYLIITDSFKKIRNFDVIKNILENKKNYGFSIFIIDNKINNLPDQCSTFIQINKEQGELRNNTNYSDVLHFTIDFITPIDYDLCTKKLSNIPIEIDGNSEGQLPNKLGFLELFDVGKIEQLNSSLRWRKSNPMLNLGAVVGIGKNGEKISIDLHEKYHGPHGLIAGMTGSGKSEFIITYILSMAINYHPYEVQFILIDYKGGGLAGAFENEATGVKLPHLVGTITNLDINEIKRSLASIESELKRRQALFNQAREISNESTIDIYKYQKMYRDGIVKEPISHLFIISDEFAELKNQQPEFMEQLISTARIGRSLGVHLILATQKPSGVVDPQIWSNTRFRVCMRVQDKSDSNEVIKCPDAAYLKQTGRFYFQVGYNEVFILGQAAWAGGKYLPSETVNKTLDTSINFINNIGYSIRSEETKIRKVITTSNGEELSNIVKYLYDLGKQENINCKPLWLDKIPADIRIDSLSVKYNYQKEDFVINPIIGEYDVPTMQQQRLLTLPLSKEGNAVVYGASGSGKENFITTLIYSSMMYYTPEEINYYIIDFGSKSLNMFKNCPIVGDILSVDDEEKTNNLYKMIDKTIEQRKQLFAEYNGDYYNFCKNSGKSVPNIVIVINNYESYQETYENLDDLLVVLSRDCNKYGIYFVVTVNTPNGMRFKLKQNFSLNYVLQQNSEDDYITILGNVHKNYPAKIFGRGIFKTDDIYEFQTALATKKDEITKFVKEQCLEYGNKYKTKARKIPILPSVVKFEDIVGSKNRNNNLIIGLNKEDLEVCKFDFAKNYTTLLTSQDLSNCENLVNLLIKEIIKFDTSSLAVINAEDFLVDENYINRYQYIDQKFNEIFESLTDFLNKQNEVYKKNDYDKKIFKDKRPIDCIIIGIESFKKRLSEDNQTKFADLFNLGKELGIINFIIVDSVDIIKKIEFESWYKNCIDNTSGIWIGNGFNDQFTLKSSQKLDEMKQDITNEFCFVIIRGKAKYVKYIESIDL